jgi:hypothetical protein
MTEHKEAVPLRDAEQETECAEVPVRDVEVLRLHRRKHRLQQTAFLGVPVLAAHHLRRQSGLWLQHNQRLARQRPRRTIAKNSRIPL